MIGHAAKHDLLTALKTSLEGVLSVVPFAGSESLIAVLLEDFAKRGVTGHLQIAEMKQRATGVQHGSTRHADGAVWRTKAIGIVKTES